LRPRDHLTRFDKKHATDGRTGDGSHKVDRRDTVLRQNLNLRGFPRLLLSKSAFANLLANARRALTEKVSPLPTRTLAVMRPHFADRRPKNAFPSHLVQRFLWFETKPYERGLDVVILCNVLAQDPKPWDALNRKLLVDLRTTQEEKLVTYDSPTEPRLLDPSTTKLSPSLRHRLSLLPLDIPRLQHSLKHQGLAQRGYDKTTLTLAVQDIREMPNNVPQNLAARSEQVHSRRLHKFLVLQATFGFSIEMRTIAIVIFERTDAVDHRDLPSRQDQGDLSMEFLVAIKQFLRRLVVTDVKHRHRRRNSRRNQNRNW
jgi:hypothetical protein